MCNEILAKIKEYETIIIHRHMRPDGDCIGSQFGLKYFIMHNFPEKKVYAVGDEIPDYLSFIGSNDEISDDIYKDALVIVVDTSVRNRICDNRYQTGAYLIKIDHHDDSESYGDIEYVNPKAPACCQMITHLLNESNLEIPKNASIALYTGLTTDTGRFQFRGVDEVTFDAAKILVKTGIEIDDIYARIGLKDFNQIRLEAYLFKHMKKTQNGVIYIYFSKRTMQKYKVTKEQAAGLVSALSNIKGCPIWLTFVDYDENIRVRIRSRKIAVNEIGVKYHGGGHLQACGATVYSKKEMKALIKDCDILLKEFKKTKEID